MRYLIDVILELFWYTKIGAENEEDDRDYKASDHIKLKGATCRKHLIDNINVQDQKRTNHCTAYSCAHALSSMDTIKKKMRKTVEGEDVWGLQLELGTADEDRGDFINSAPKAVCKYGTTNKMLEPVHPEKYVYVREEEAKAILESGRCIMSGARIGTPMCDSNYYLKRGGSGGHAFLVIGFDDQKRHWICINSWGHGWGHKNQGIFFVKYEDGDLLFRSYCFA